MLFSDFSGVLWVLKVLLVGACVITALLWLCMLRERNERARWIVAVAFLVELFLWQTCAREIDRESARRTWGELGASREEAARLSTSLAASTQANRELLDRNRELVESLEKAKGGR